MCSLSVGVDGFIAQNRRRHIDICVYLDTENNSESVIWRVTYQRHQVICNHVEYVLYLTIYAIKDCPPITVGMTGTAIV